MWKCNGLNLVIHTFIMSIFQTHGPRKNSKGPLHHFKHELYRKLSTLLKISSSFLTRNRSYSANALVSENSAVLNCSLNALHYFGIMCL